MTQGADWLTWITGLAGSSAPAPPPTVRDVGTNKITKEGLAYVHEGEMIVPKEFSQISSDTGPYTPLLGKINSESTDSNLMKTLTNRNLQLPEKNEMFFSKNMNTPNDNASKAPETLLNKTDSFASSVIGGLNDFASTIGSKISGVFDYFQGNKPNEEKILGRTGHTSSELLDVQKEMLKLDLAMKDADKRSRMFAEKFGSAPDEMSKIIAQLNQTASVPEYTDNKLISNNSRMQAQIAATVDRKQEMNLIEEKNSSEILNVLMRIDENTKSSGSSGPSKMNGGGEPYVNLVYTTRTRVDPKLGNMMGGNYTSNDSIKATK
jgi:hypothetical protein